jgi:hypothetical protein
MKLSIFLFFLIFIVELTCIQHAFIYKVKEDGLSWVKEDGVKKTIKTKKLFVDLIIEGRIFRKKKAYGNRQYDSVFEIQFVCKTCEVMAKKWVTCRVEVTVVNVDDVVCK